MGLDGLLLVGALVVGGGCCIAVYAAAVPSVEDQPLRPTPLDRSLGAVLYGLAYALGILRAPLGIIPYLCKLSLFLIFGFRYTTRANSAWFEGLRVGGDAANLLVSGLYIRWLLGTEPAAVPAVILGGMLGAEAIRLGCEKGVMIWSCAWQHLPHRRLAAVGDAWLARHPDHGNLTPLVRYCRYYHLPDDERAAVVLSAIRRRGAADPDLARRLAYVHAFRIVPFSHCLRAGDVRDIGGGAVLIHAAWTADPWLLAGLALRRGPWLFDPRYVRRPFSYRREGNRAMTLAVLRHAWFSPPFTIFVFGHEIKAARYDLFFRAARWCGLEIEAPVLADGTYPFDQLIQWIARLKGERTPGNRRTLPTEDQVRAEAGALAGRGVFLSAPEIAERYALAVEYVEEAELPSPGGAPASGTDARRLPPDARIGEITAIG